MNGPLSRDTETVSSKDAFLVLNPRMVGELMTYVQAFAKGHKSHDA